MTSFLKASLGSPRGAAYVSYGVGLIELSHRIATYGLYLCEGGLGVIDERIPGDD